MSSPSAESTERRRGRFARPPHIGFTVRASCLLAAGATALLCGALLGVTDLSRAGVLALAVPLVAAVFVHRSRIGIGSERAVEPSSAVAGSRATVRLTISNRSALPSGALMLEDGLPRGVPGRARFVLDGLAGRESRTVAYTMPPLPRGRYTAGPLRIRAVDPFGLVDLTRSFTATSDFLVTPRVDPLPDGGGPAARDTGENLGSHSIGARGADDASTREYRIGDDLRKIHWRSTARTGALMVRQEERPWQGQTTILLDLRAAGHVLQGVAKDEADERAGSSLEWAISASASIASHLSRSGRAVSLVDDLTTGVAVHYPAASLLVEHLADAAPGPGTDVTALAAAVRAAGREATVIAVLGRLNPTAARSLAEARPRAGTVSAYAILLDTVSWGSFDGDSAEPGAAWHEVADILGASGWQVAPARRGDRVGEVWTRLLARAEAGRRAGQLPAGFGGRR